MSGAVATRFSQSDTVPCRSENVTLRLRSDSALSTDAMEDTLCHNCVLNTFGVRHTAGDFASCDPLAFDDSCTSKEPPGAAGCVASFPAGFVRRMLILSANPRCFGGKLRLSIVDEKTLPRGLFGQAVAHGHSDVRP